MIPLDLLYYKNEKEEQLNEEREEEILHNESNQDTINPKTETPRQQEELPIFLGKRDGSSY